MKDFNHDSTNHSLFLDQEHQILRDQIKRFVDEKVKPNGIIWEKNGFIPREIFIEMGKLGFLGITYPSEYGGSAMDPRGSVILAEELGRSTFSGFAIATLVHTDMASVHLLNAGNQDQREKYLKEIISLNQCGARMLWWETELLMFTLENLEKK